MSESESSDFALSLSLEEYDDFEKEASAQNFKTRTSASKGFSFGAAKKAGFSRAPPVNCDDFVSNPPKINHHDFMTEYDVNAEFRVDREYFFTGHK